MIIRTYCVHQFTDVFEYAAMAGSLEDKVATLFKSSKASEVLRQLDIPWSVGVASLGEIVIGMNEEQYLLWNIAGGEDWCSGREKSEFFFEECERVVFEIGSFLNSRPGANLRPWKLVFADQMAIWSRGDCYQIAIRESGFVRGLCFPRTIELLDSPPYVSSDALLAKFSFAKEIGF